MPPKRRAPPSRGGNGSKGVAYFGPGFVRRFLVSPPLLKGASASTCGTVAGIVSCVSGMLAAAVLAALLSPPAFPQHGFDAASLTVLSRYGICLRLALVSEFISFFFTLGVGAVTRNQKPNTAAAAALLSLSLWALMIGIWFTAAAASAAVWSALPLRNIAATVTGGVGVAIVTSMAMFFSILSIQTR